MAKKKKKLSKDKGKKRGGAFANSLELNAKDSNKGRVSQGMKIINEFENSFYEYSPPMNAGR